tara:strand:- start:62 stop:301 length:240 start_codon:yes stop_codon:yes gene_type:complete
MNRADAEIKKLSTIGNWAKSCETPEQLKTVEKFMRVHMSNIEPFMFSRESHEVMYHCGIVDGIILSIGKLKIKNAKHRD